MFTHTKQIDCILNKSVVSCSMPKALQTNKGKNKMYKDKYKHLTTKQLEQKIEMLKYAEMNEKISKILRSKKQTNKGRV